MRRARFSVNLDLTQSTQLQHYPSPLVTSANTVIIPVRMFSYGSHEVRAYDTFGNILWRVPSLYLLPPQGNSFWTPFYQVCVSLM